MRNRHRRANRGGFTLLEVILSLALGMLVMMIIGLAIDAHVTVSQRGRGKVEQAQLARSVLRLISDDLRSTIHYKPLDFSSVANLNLDADVGGSTGDDASGGGTGNPSGSGNQSGSSGGQNGNSQGGPTNPTQANPGTQIPGANPGSTQGVVGGTTQAGGQKPPTSTGGAAGGASAGGSTGGKTGGNTSSGNAGSGSTGSGSSSSGSGSGSGSRSGSGSGGGSSGSSSSSDSSEEEQPPLPGVYGTKNQLEVDVSRPLRVDEYEQLLSSGGGSDVKTVAYYIGDGSAGAGVSAASSAAGSDSGGLMRRALDKAATEYAMTNGGALNANGQMLAPEVTAIEFLYFDGSQWAETWDTTEKGGPPVAVEVAIAVRSTAPSSIIARAWSAVSGSADEPEETVYRQVVYLPAAEPTSSSDSSGTSTDSGSSTGGSQ